MIPILLIVTAMFRPAKPTVGDPITVQFAALVVLDASPNYEIVSQHGNTVVIRTFQPKPFTISGRTGDVLFRNMVVPVHSVLKPADDMAPAPLKPPRAEPYPRAPIVAIALAALAAIAAWTVAAIRREKARQPEVPALPPDVQFRVAVIALRDDSRAPRRWSRLADALRVYLAATSALSLDLTTSELLASISGERAPIIAEILRQGDLEKFSPWGPMAGNFELVANQALALAPEPVIEEQAA